VFSKVVPGTPLCWKLVAKQNDTVQPADKPMLYVRKKPKGFGRGAQIEGDMPEGARVILVEDLSTDGGSKVAFANALRDGGAVISDVFSVFFYGIFKESAKILGDAGLTLH
jgi:orotate phosphoribosyltransferase